MAILAVTAFSAGALQPKKSSLIDSEEGRPQRAILRPDSKQGGSSCGNSSQGHWAPFSLLIGVCGFLGPKLLHYRFTDFDRFQINRKAPWCILVNSKNDSANCHYLPQEHF